MKAFILSFIATGVIALTNPALAQSYCQPRESITKKLKENHGKDYAFGGIQKMPAGMTGVMEIWVSEESRTYTVLVTLPTGISCIVAVGTDFFVAIPEIEIPGVPG